MARQVSKGKCNLCGRTFSKTAMTKHLGSCRPDKSASQTSSAGRRPRKTKAFHLRVEGRYLPDYWMHLEVPANATFAVLDNFLRRAWLECCGHMSAFRVGDTSYSIAPMAESEEAGMGAKLGEVLCPATEFYHEYDFGTTTYLTLRVVSEGQAQIKAREVRVLARNEPPSISCVSCGKIATQVCTECLWSGAGWLCDKCAAEHECGQDMLLPVVNSPRVGMCGYTGD